jgi:hypothetical protein
MNPRKQLADFEADSLTLQPEGFAASIERIRRGHGRCHKTFNQVVRFPSEVETKFG